MARQGSGSFSLFKKADVEGYLDKLSSGITSRLVSGKAKVWCELYGVTLFIFKENKRSSTGAQQLNMTQVQMVRKATSDKTGMQFEVLCKNKSQTFCAYSIEDCNKWIGHLRRAMTLKDQGTRQQQNTTSEISVGDYETINVLPEDTRTAPLSPLRHSTASESGYAEIGFLSTTGPPQQPATDGSKNPAASTETETQQPGMIMEDEFGYATVDTRTALGAGQPVQPVPGAAGNSTPTPSAPLTMTQSSNTEEEYAYATVDVRAKRGGDQSEQAPSMSAMPRTEADGSEEESTGYATVSCNPRSANVSPDSDRDPRSCGDGASDEDDPIVYAEPGPIPSFPHPLKSEDLEPLAGLQEFLSDNRKVCRMSFVDRAPAEDPVGDMKRFLQELCL